MLDRTRADSVLAHGRTFNAELGKQARSLASEAGSISDEAVRRIAFVPARHPQATSASFSAWQGIDVLVIKADGAEGPEVHRARTMFACHSSACRPSLVPRLASPSVPRGPPPPIAHRTDRAAATPRSSKRDRVISPFRQGRQRRRHVAATTSSLLLSPQNRRGSCRLRALLRFTPPTRKPHLLLPAPCRVPFERAPSSPSKYRWGISSADAALGDSVVGV